MRAGGTGWLTALALLSVMLLGCRTEVVNSLELRPPEIDADDCPGSGRALAFDGIGARVVADLGGALPIGNAPRTVELWAYVQSTSWDINRYTLFEYGSRVPHQAFAIDMDVFPTMQVYSWDDDIYFDSGLTSKTGWLHVAATFDGTTIRAFVNGTERAGTRKGPASSLDSKWTLMTTPTPVRLGWSPNTEPEAHFDGLIDEVRIWNVARTGDEIRRTMSVRLAGNEPSLVAYWRLDEGEGTVAHDSSPLGHDAILELGPIWVPSTVPLGCSSGTTNP